MNVSTFLRERFRPDEATPRPSSRESLELLFDLAPDAFYLCDLTGTFIDGNRAAEELSGYAREDLIGKSFLKLSLLPPGQIARAAASLARCGLGYSVGPEDYTLRRRDGERISIQVTTVPIRMDGKTFVLGIARDVTERRRTARELEEQARRYALAVRVGVWDWDLETNEIKVDPIVEEMLGYDAGEIGTHIDDWHRQVHEEDADAKLEATRACIVGESDGLNIELRMVARDGSTTWFLVRGHLVKDDAGKPTRMVGTDTDITRLKEMERALRRSRDDLEELVRERTQELEEANAQLRKEAAEREAVQRELVRVQRLTALGEMSAGVSHNLNNLLTGILAPAEVIRDEVRDEELRRHAETVIRAGGRAADLVRRLHRAVGADGETPEPVDLREAIQDALQSTRPRWKDEMEGKGTQIDVGLWIDDLPPVRATPTGLYEVFVNLLLNAVDALPEGGRIKVHAERAGNLVRVKFSDSGLGMAEETRRRVFEPFFTTKATVGTGLGLSMVYGEVTRWGGRIDVESEPGSGTTLTLDLPAAEDAPTAASGRRRAADGYDSRILVVDDDAYVRATMERVLSETHRITSYAGGGTALSAFRPDRYDVAVIDLGLPEIPGDRLAREIAVVDPCVARILITGWQLEPDDERLEPFDFHVSKPFVKSDDIRRLISRALALSRERRRLAT